MVTSTESGPKQTETLCLRCSLVVPGFSGRRERHSWARCMAGDLAQLGTFRELLQAVTDGSSSLALILPIPIGYLSLALLCDLLILEESWEVTLSTSVP